MAYIFEINKTSATNGPVEDWGKSAHIHGHLINSIDDTLTGAQGVSKMGTSIPSPFARMFLFAAAFNMVTEDHNGSNPYHHLVSECFDMLEFLFMKGNDKDLVIKEWNRGTAIAGLGQSKPKHQQLGKSLEDAVQSDLSGIDRIYLFFYKDTLIGGTSPMTLVFTSPNWKRKWLSRNQAELQGGKFNKLFNQVTPLHERSENFREFIQKFRIAYADTLQQQCEHFYNYIDRCINTYDDVINGKFIANRWNANYTRENLLEEYPYVCMDTTPIISGGFPLLRQSDILPDFRSDYKMKPTVEHYQKELPTGTTLRHKPLILNENGIEGAIYFSDQTWDMNRCRLDPVHIKSTPWHSRELPGVGTKIPYLVASDFLEDTLIELSYKINKERFETCYAGDVEFLLPVKREYFNFFTLENLKRQLSIKITKERGEMTVQVVLKIPIDYNATGYITLTKNYTQADIKNYRAETNTFNMVLFPFYKITDAPALNKYCILLGDSTNGLKMNFYRFGNATQLEYARPIKRTSRMDEGSYLDSNYIYLEKNMDNTFDLIEVGIGSDRGLIIPKFEGRRSIRTADATENFIFCVDFGTTNTHIAYSTNAGVHSNSFDIGKEDMQYAFLNASANNPNVEEDYRGGFGPFKLFLSTSEREFVPALIGGSQAWVTYPVRTATCETSTFKNGSELHLFGNISLGYFMMKELKRPENAVYITDLKWALEKQPANNVHANRIKAFCKQLVWMFKNKAVLNRGKVDFKIILTFPGTMSNGTKITYLNAWKESVTELMGNANVAIIEQSESVVPYYSFVRDYIAPSQDAVNVDIGGGTNDILFVINNGPKQGSYYTSSLFAGNDLWGDGTSKFPQKNNGFYQYVQSKIDSGEIILPTDDNIGDDRTNRRRYDTFKDMASSSADIISFMFKYNNNFLISGAIMNHPGLYPLVYIHFSALLYYIAKVIKRNDFPLPTYLTFTGMGSKYLGLISQNEATVAAYARLLLEKFTGKIAPDSFEVKLAASPKVITAEGGLMSQNPQINSIKPAYLKEYGFEGNGADYMYKEITDTVKKAVLAEFDTFINLLSGNDVARHLNDNNHNVNLTVVINALRRHLGISYDEVYAQRRVLGDDATVNDTLFFWPLKKAIYEVSKELWNKK
jgi:hypothetical protein